MSDPDGEPAGASEAADESYDLPEIIPATIDVPVQPDRPERRVTPVVAPTPAPRPRPAVPSKPVQAAQPARSQPSVPAVDASRATGQPMPAVVPTGPGPGLRDPGRRPRVRRVTRVIRHVDPWSTFKLALVFSLVTYLVVLTSGVLLWQVADSTGTLDNVERWFTQFGWETFEFKGGEIFHNAWIIGLFGAVALTGAAVLAATLFNLVSDIVGGIRVTVLEEEVVERTASSARRYVVRRPPVSTPVTTAQTWSVDDD